MRHVFVVLDMSSAMTEQDLKPNRHLAATKVCTWHNFFMGFIISLHYS